MTRYKIMGRYNGTTEEIDEATDKADKDYLLKEYRMAFGAGWSLWARPCKD